MKESEVEKELAKGEATSIIALVDSLVEESYDLRASDVHIDPNAKEVRVRLRIDGVLHDTFTFPKEIQSEVVTRIKVLAGLRTDEHQVPQDGRFRVIREEGAPIDIRVSIAPTYYGENIVLRLLSEQADKFTLAMLGFSPKACALIERAATKPYGMILVTGPTGSGKTTTLYTVLKQINTKEIAITTIEDPIEYSIEGINQVQANANTGLTFANGLRSMLRQDPDVIMVGEIRDPETAGLAVNTALTGHLVLSTLHTNDAATTLPRLLDLGAEPYLIAATVNIIVGQRLVRKICEKCKTSRKITDADAKNLLHEEAREAFANIDTLWFGKGCEACGDSGYFGRQGIYEVMPITESIRKAMLRSASAYEIKQIAIEAGMRTLVKDGFDKVANGVTTIEEILRVIHE